MYDCETLSFWQIHMRARRNREIVVGYQKALGVTRDASKFDGGNQTPPTHRQSTGRGTPTAAMAAGGGGAQDSDPPRTARKPGDASTVVFAPLEINPQNKSEPQVWSQADRFIVIAAPMRNLGARRRSSRASSAAETRQLILQHSRNASWLPS